MNCMVASYKAWIQAQEMGGYSMTRDTHVENPKKHGILTRWDTSKSI